MNKTEITRTVQIEDRTIHIHIHLTEDEIRRLLLPRMASELLSQMVTYRTASGGSTTANK